MTSMKRIWMDGDTMRVDEISPETFYRAPKQTKMIVDGPTADRIQSLIADNERLREALTIIAGDMNYGHCRKCKQPCAGVTMCDCNASWEPNDPVDIARDALSHKDMSRDHF